MSFFADNESRVPSSRRAVLMVLAALAGLSVAGPVNPGGAKFAAFLGAAVFMAWLFSRDATERVEVARFHRERVFAEDPVEVRLRVRQTGGPAKTLVVVEDQFFASLSPRQRRLAPLLSSRWEVLFHYIKTAERHRGVYFLGPLTIHAGDPMGVFIRSHQIDCVTSLTIYPRPHPLPGYVFAGPRPPAGPALDNASRVGQGEEIIGVRPYRPGDPPSRIHWRTSMRRGGLHVIELDTTVQSDVVIFLDLARSSRYGTGHESTTEMAIGCAVSVLSEASAGRRRLGLLEVREKERWFPPASGIAHLHMILDRLAVTAPEGDLDFWALAAPHAVDMRPGSRAVFIVTGTRTDPAQSIALTRELTARGVAVDMILIDESHMTRIWRDQRPTTATAELDFERLKMALGFAGARVLPLKRDENAEKLLPRASETPR